MAHYPAVSEPLEDAIQWIRRNVHILQRLSQGKMNVNDEITLDANQASTTITDARIGFETNILLVPETANASAEVAAGTIYVSGTNRLNGSVVITHANNAQTDRTFRVSYIG